MAFGLATGCDEEMCLTYTLNNQLITCITKTVFVTIKTDKHASETLYLEIEE